MSEIGSWFKNLNRGPQIAIIMGILLAIILLITAICLIATSNSKSSSSKKHKKQKTKEPEKENTLKQDDEIVPDNKKKTESEQSSTTTNVILHDTINDDNSTDASSKTDDEKSKTDNLPSDESKKKLDEILKQQKDLKDAFEKQQQEMKENLEKQQKNYQDELAKQAKENQEKITEALKKQKEETDKQLEEIKKRYQSSNSEKDIKNSQKDNDNLDTYNKADLQDYIKKLQERLEKLEKNPTYSDLLHKDAWAKQLSSLQDQLEQLDKELQEANDENENWDQFKTRCKDIKTDIDGLEFLLKKANKLKDKIKKNNSRLRPYLEKEDNQYKDENQKALKIKSDLDDIDGKLNNKPKVNDLDELDKKLDALRKKIQELEAQAKAKEKAIKDLDRLKKQAKRLKKKISDNDDEDDYNKKLDDMQNKIDELEEELDDKDFDKERMENEIEELKENMKELQWQLSGSGQPPTTKDNKKKKENDKIGHDTKKWKKPPYKKRYSDEDPGEETDEENEELEAQKKELKKAKKKIGELEEELEGKNDDKERMENKIKKLKEDKKKLKWQLSGSGQPPTTKDNKKKKEKDEFSSKKPKKKIPTNKKSYSEDIDEETNKNGGDSESENSNKEEYELDVRKYKIPGGKNKITINSHKIPNLNTEELENYLQKEIEKAKNGNPDEEQNVKKIEELIKEYNEAEKQRFEQHKQRKKRIEDALKQANMLNQAGVTLDAILDYILCHGSSKGCKHIPSTRDPSSLTNQHPDLINKPVEDIIKTLGSGVRSNTILNILCAQPGYYNNKAYIGCPWSIFGHPTSSQKGGLTHLIYELNSRLCRTIQMILRDAEKINSSISTNIHRKVTPLLLLFIHEDKTRQGITLYDKKTLEDEILNKTQDVLDPNNGAFRYNHVSGYNNGFPVFKKKMRYINLVAHHEAIKEAILEAINIARSNGTDKNTLIRKVETYFSNLTEGIKTLLENLNKQKHNRNKYFNVYKKINNEITDKKEIKKIKKKTFNYYQS